MDITVVNVYLKRIIISQTFGNGQIIFKIYKFPMILIIMIS